MRIDRIKLITEMAKQDITCKRLAEQSKISRVTINSVRCGKSCSEATAIKLAKGLGVKVSDLIEREGV